MTAQSRASTGETTKIYRVNAINHQLFSYSLLIVLPLLAIFLIALLISDFKHGQLSPATIIALLAFGCFTCISVWSARHYYDTTLLMLSRGGIEYHGQGIVIQTSWENVKELTHGATPCLLLRKPAAKFKSLRTMNDWYADQRIPLYRFDYTHNSPLAQDLRRFAPELFQ